jgi:hypothetical protein
VHCTAAQAETIEFRQRALGADRRESRATAATEQARWTAFLYGAVHGDGAAASGWMARAERILR